MKWKDPAITIDLLDGASGLGLKYASRTAPSKGTATDVLPTPDGRVNYQPFISSSIYTSTVDGHLKNILYLPLTKIAQTTNHYPSKLLCIMVLDLLR